MPCMDKLITFKLLFMNLMIVARFQVNELRTSMYVDRFRLLSHDHYHITHCSVFGMKLIL